MLTCFVLNFEPCIESTTEILKLPVNKIVKKKNLAREFKIFMVFT